MRPFMRACALGLMAAVSLPHLAPPAQAADYDTTFTMTFLCEDGPRGSRRAYPVQGATVLVSTGNGAAPWEISAPFTSTGDPYRTDANGRLEIRVASDYETWASFELRLEDDNIAVRQWPNDDPWSYSIGKNQNDVPVRDFGTIIFSNDGRIGSPPCAVFEGARRSFADFTSLVGASPNVFNVIDMASPAANGQARSVANKTSLPLGYKVDPTDPIRFRNSAHEFAYIARNSLDNAGTYQPGREHGVCQRTDTRFAYQEGWALYWSGMFGPAPRCTKPKSAPNDYRVEGNVAAAFALITELCPSIGPAQFANVMGQFPKQIKTFAQFKSKFDQIYTCDLGQLVLTTPSDVASKGLTTAQMAKAGKRYLIAANSLAKQLNKAVVTRKPPPCTTLPCANQVLQAIEPSISRLQRDQARLLAKAGNQAYSKAAIAQAGKLSPTKAAKRATSLDRTYTKALAKAAKRDLRQALAALKVYLKKGDPTARQAATWLKSAITSYKKGTVPLGLALKDPAVKITTQPGNSPPPGTTCVIDRTGQKVCS